MLVPLLDREIVRLGWAQMLRDKLEMLARKELTDDDHTAMEATESEYRGRGWSAVALPKSGPDSQSLADAYDGLREG